MARNKSQPHQRQRSLTWLQGLLCGALATVATPTALLLGVLLAPVLVAVALDQEPGRPKARSIALFGMAASVAPLRTLWTSGHTLAMATTLLANLDIVGTAWSAAAAGWLLAELMPFAARAVIEALSIARKSRLEAERARLVQAWGLERPEYPPASPKRAV
jgi:hypothetical protein